MFIVSLFLQVKHVTVLTLHCLIFAKVIARLVVDLRQCHILTAVLAAAQFQQGVILLVFLGIVHGVELECAVLMLCQTDIKAIVGYAVEVMHFRFELRYALLHGHAVAKLVQQGEFLLYGLAVGNHLVQRNVLPGKEHTPFLSVLIGGYAVFPYSLAAYHLHLIGTQARDATDELL